MSKNISSFSQSQDISGKIDKNFPAAIDFLLNRDILNTMKKTIITLNEVKRQNLRSVLSLLLHSDGLSRIEIAGKLGCDNTTVSRAVRELIERGIIDTGSKNNTAAGRPRIALRMNPAGPLLIGIAWEPDGITGMLTDLKSEPLRVENIRFRHSPDREEYLTAAAEIIQKLEQAADKPVSGVGVTVFGSYFGPDFTLEKVASLPVLNGLQLRPFLSGCTTCGELMICDHSVAVSNYLVRRYPEFNSGSAMLITSGKGLGVVLLENGRRLFSRNNHGGEFGHAIHQPGGPLCACGRRGCLETLVSTSALLKQYRKESSPKATFEQFAKDFCEQKKAAGQIVFPAIKILANAVAEQLNNFPADKLILSGEILKFGNRMESCFRESVKDALFTLAKNDLNFYFPASDAKDLLATGASMLAAENFCRQL